MKTKRQLQRRREQRAKRDACAREVWARAKARCERCGIAISTKRPKWHPQRAHLNHKVPLSKGGEDTSENCELICQACHMPDGQHAPTKARMDALRREPKEPW